MAYLFSYGCDAQMSLAHKWDVVDTNSSIVADAGKFGTGTDSMKLIDDSDFNVVRVARSHTIGTGKAGNALHMSFYIKIASLPTSVKQVTKFFQSSNTDGAMLFIATSGTLHFSKVESSPTNTSIPHLVGGSSALSTGNWHHVELKYVDDLTVGIAKLWIDGALEIDFSGNTRDAGAIASFSDVAFYGIGANTDTEFDDILVWDEEGSSMNTSGQLGLHRVETLIPNGDGTTNNFTPVGAGTTNADRVDEEGADDDTTYVHSATSTNKELYTYSAMAGAPLVIQGVVVHSRMANSDLGPIIIKEKVRSTATEADGTSSLITSGGVYSQRNHFFALDPDGDIAWTKTKVNAAEFGIEVV